MAMSPRLLRPVSAFNPKSISGLNLWVDFSDASTVTLDVNDKISNVTDKSGSGYNGAQSTSGNRPGISTLNGRQCLDNGTSANSFSLVYTHVSATLNFQDGYIAAVWDGGGSTFPTFNGLISGASVAGSVSGALWLGQSGQNRVFSFANWHNQAGGSVMSINNTSATNGSTLAAFPAITSTFVTRGSANSAITVNGWRIGDDRAEGGRGWLGRIGEVCLFNRQLSAAESLRMRRYLARKWGAPDQT